MNPENRITITFVVPFVKGKARPRFARGRAYTPKTTHDAEQAILNYYKAECMDEFGRVLCAPKGTPVTLRVYTERPLPKSRPKSVESEPDVFKPDADNVLKLVADALNGVAYVDDSQLTDVSIVKGDRERGAVEKIFILIHYELEDESEVEP